MFQGIRRLRGLAATGVGVLAAVGVLVLGSASSPATAAQEPAVFIQNTLTRHCLDQHFAANGQPTVTVFAWWNPCHTQGNQQWRIVLGANNTSKIVNVRAPHWCLSHPQAGRVYAEICNGAPKQLWKAESINSTANRLRNQQTQLCLEEVAGNEVYGFPCDNSYPGQYWRWAPTQI